MSAVKAIGMAMGEGQKVFKFTPQMYADEPGLVQSRLPQHSVDTKNRVLQALAGGLEVTIHERPLTRGSWHGAGYTTIDPETGGGGYLVEDAGNGGLLELIDNLQKYLFTPHIVGFSYGAGFKAFADTFGNFAGLFRYDSPNEAYEDNKRFMDAMTYLPSFGSKGGILWMMVQMIWTATR